MTPKLNVVIDLRRTAPDLAATRAESHARDAGWAAFRSPAAFRSLEERRIAFITCVNDEEQYATCVRYIDALDVPAGFSIEKIAVLGAPSMAAGYQAAMEASAARYKVYLHQDVYLIHRGLLHELLRLFRTYPRLGMVGVVGTTRLPRSGVWFANNPFHCYGRVWEYRRPGGPAALLGPANRRRLHLMRFRSFVGDYLTAAAVDGLLVATQYDLPWQDVLGGFELYEQVHALQCIRAGLEVGIARQEAVWCLHWGPWREPSREEARRRSQELARRAEAFRRLYGEFIGVPAQELVRRYRPAAPGTVAWPKGGLAEALEVGVPQEVRQEAGATSLAEEASAPSRAAAAERLGVVIVTFNGRDVLRRALGALIPQCEGLAGVEWEIVVVDNASTDGTVEAIRREFPQVAVVANASNDGPARGFNVGLRRLGIGGPGPEEAGEARAVPDYVLVMNNDVEFVDGTLARMVGYLREHLDVAGVVASLTNPDGSEQFQRLATLELIPRRPRHPAPVTFVGTTCALVRGAVLWDVGLYDERFYFFNEDLEWSLRAKRKGYRFVFLPNAKVIHFGSVGMRQNRPAIFADLPAANLWYFYKHAGPRWAALMYGVQRLQGWVQAWRGRGDPQAVAQAREAVSRMQRLYRRLREADAPPEVLR